LFTGLAFVTTCQLVSGVGVTVGERGFLKVGGTLLGYITVLLVGEVLVFDIGVLLGEAVGSVVFRESASPRG
jgi:hypothetical protein